ncbi:putative receptor-like protein kinase [Morus notabilis]|uniref:Putative receptor-like protein kinase n=1 Tax=Morus notabilis TaxID=981085 RepID=W9STX1_9ROSA|nr:probable receptor-like protein kinase At1g33260 isoform X1 [Morus notabilis]EXC26251.1 putative receptor-like protein kinase [Morus notabilis]
MQNFLKCFGKTNSSFRSKRQQISQTSQGLDDDHDHHNNNKVLAEPDDSITCSSIVVRKFSWEEIEKFTNNFCSSRVIGYGGFSTVYLAGDLIPSTTSTGGNLAAIKIINGSRLFKQELDILRQLHHRNIVGLIGYCDDRGDQGALVLDYISNGGLEDKLHGGVGETSTTTTLPWRNRMAIALQVAEALEYLHEKCGGLPIVHGDIKASNVLLDRHLNCRLCDFGSANVGFSSAVTPGMRPNRAVMMGSPGYTDPHYLRTGIPSKKNDVYSFGVLLLELVTGMQAFCSESNRTLASRVGPTLGGDDMVVAELVDPRLAGEFEAEEARALLSLSAECLRQPPTLRPSASQILQALNDNVSFIPPSIQHTYHGSKNLLTLQK